MKIFIHQAICLLTSSLLSTPTAGSGGEVSLEGSLLDDSSQDQEWPDEQLDWDELTDEQQEFLRRHRYTERLWDCDAEPDSLYRWEELSLERQEMWELRGWNKQRWEEEDDCWISMQMSTPEDFKPLVVDIAVPQLDEVTLERLREYNSEIRLVDGYAAYTSEEFSKSMPLNKFIENVQ